MGGISWIKIETTFPSKPVVLKLRRMLNLSRSETIGNLIRVLCWADGVTSDGSLNGMTVEDIDEVVTCEGFGAALMEVGWLTEIDGILCFSNWDLHNGATAKKRALEVRRSEKYRDKKRKVSRTESDEHHAPSVTNPEKERELDKIREEYKRNTNVFPKERVREKASALDNSGETYSIQDGAATWICPKNHGDNLFLDAYAKQPKSVRAYQVAWATAIKRVAPEILISCAQIYREQMTDEDYRFQLAPENWLADRRYEQYMGEAKSRSTFARTTVMLAPLPGEED